MKQIRPGLHKSLDSFVLKNRGFTEEEIKIILNLSKGWLITKAGEVRLSKTAVYKYILMKPTSKLQEMFNFEKEVGVVFSDFQDLHQRTLDAFDTLNKTLAAWRIEIICSVLISKDNNVEQKINDFIRSDTEAKIIVPFSYSELSCNLYNNNIIENKFRKYFYDRDLFSFNAPLKKEVYFFGRKDLIQQIINKHKSNENSGLFGLRKTGKTSVIFGIKRALEREKAFSPIIIDCQDPSFNLKSWNKALYYMCLQTFESIKAYKKAENKKLQLKEPNENSFSNENASHETKIYLMSCKDIMKCTLFFIFDEIENISVKTSPVEHWKNGKDFIPFWQTLRSIFQSETNLLSYLLIGTNPYSIEIPTINGSDNPIYNFITPEYIEGFNVIDTKEMVDKLGKIMGLKFNEVIFSKLTEDFGGHPFLIRQVCRIVNEIVKKQNINKPAVIDRNLYNKAKENFVQTNNSYIEMILTVLSEYYSDELTMLEYLALNNITEFHSFAEDPSLINHLLGYGIISHNNDAYDFKIDLIKEFLLKKNKYKNKNLTNSEKLAEISERRNKIEPKLRKLVSSILLSNKGFEDSKKIVLDIFGSPRKERLKLVDYHKLFNPEESEIYFLDLAKIISKEWDIFKNIFSKSKQETFKYFEKINYYRNDAHAKNIEDEDFNLFRIYIKNIEQDLEHL